MTPDERTQFKAIHARMEKGEYFNDICKEIGASIYRMMSVFDHLGLPLHKRPPNNVKGRKEKPKLPPRYSHPELPEATLREISERLMAGEFMNVLAREYKTSRSALVTALNQAGLRTRRSKSALVAAARKALTEFPTHREAAASLNLKVTAFRHLIYYKQ